MQKTRWSTAVAAATLLALPIAAFAQSTTTPPPPQQQTRPPAQVDPAAAKAHLSQARDTLSQLTSMPEAAKLQGDARTQVSQLISNFNALITTQSEWRPAYAKVDENLTAVLGPDAAPDQPVGTSGTTAALDPAIRAKLAEFRTHLRAFEEAAGGTTTNPSMPTSPANPPNPSGDVNATANANAAANADAQKELDAIAAILGNSRTGALTRAQGAQIRKHVERLRALLNQR